MDQDSLDIKPAVVGKEIRAALALLESYLTHRAIRGSIIEAFEMFQGSHPSSDTYLSLTWEFLSIEILNGTIYFFRGLNSLSFVSPASSHFPVSPCSRTSDSFVTYAWIKYGSRCNKNEADRIMFRFWIRGTVFVNLGGNVT